MHQIKQNLKSAQKRVTTYDGNEKNKIKINISIYNCFKNFFFNLFILCQFNCFLTKFNDLSLKIELIEDKKRTKIAYFIISNISLKDAATFVRSSLQNVEANFFPAIVHTNSCQFVKSFRKSAIQTEDTISCFTKKNQNQSILSRLFVLSAFIIMIFILNYTLVLQKIVIA